MMFTYLQTLFCYKENVEKNMTYVTKLLLLKLYNKYPFLLTSLLLLACKIWVKSTFNIQCV